MIPWIWFTVAGLAITASMIAIGATGHTVNKMTKPARMPIKESPSDYQMEYEDIEFPSLNDKLLMRGWYIPSNHSNHCIIMVHGGCTHRADPAIGMLGIARELVDHDFNVLMFDLRGHGKSEDGQMTGGHYERWDVHGAVAYTKNRGILPQHIGLLGFSLGGAASLLAAAEDEGIAAVVSDSSWARLTDLMDNQLQRHTNMPTFLRPLVPSITKRVHGFNITELGPADAVKKITPRPIYFIHGEVDNIVPVENAIHLYKSFKNENNRVWIVPDANHVRSYKTQPKEYIIKVIGFFDQHLK